MFCWELELCCGRSQLPASRRSQLPTKSVRFLFAVSLLHYYVKFEILMQNAGFSAAVPGMAWIATLNGGDVAAFVSILIFEYTSLFLNLM